MVGNAIPSLLLQPIISDTRLWIVSRPVILDGRQQSAQDTGSEYALPFPRRRCEFCYDVVASAFHRKLPIFAPRRQREPSQSVVAEKVAEELLRRLSAKQTSSMWTIDDFKPIYQEL